MATAVPKLRVFLSFAAIDRDAAMTVARGIEGAGLSVTGAHTLRAGSNVSRELRRQLIESSAVVAVNLTDIEGAPSVAFEVGAGLAAAKPLFAIVNNSAGRVAPIFNEARVYTLSHIDQMIHDIRAVATAAVAS